MQTESHVLPDVLPLGLSAVICGTAAGPTSAALGAYYANRRNNFWSVLQQVKLTPYKLRPNEFVALHKFGLGLTDIAKTMFGTDANLPPGAFDVASFVDKIRRCQPGIIAFNGKRAACVFYGISSGVRLAYGPSELNSPYPGFPQVFVLPSTSGTARGYWEPEYWQQFARRVKAK